MNDAALAFTEDQVDRPLSKAAKRAARRAEKSSGQPGNKPLVAKTPNQAIYLDHLRAGRHVVGVGGAGTGKTYIAARHAAKELLAGKFEKIILARVAVSKPKHAMGFLPGNIDQKMKPWVQPVIDGLRAEVSGALLDQWKTNGQFEVVPFEHMRGRSFNNACVILDEAQNADFGDLKLFLTRAGQDSQIIITGDLDQIDVPNSGLADICDLILDYDVPMEIVRFTSADVVRSPLARAFVTAFERHSKTHNHRPAYSPCHDRESRVTFIDEAPRFLHDTAHLKRAA